MATITQPIQDLINETNYDEDIKQDFYVRWLEIDEPEAEKAIELAKLVILGLYSNQVAKDGNRVRLQIENEDTIRNTHGYNDVAADPLDILTSQELEDELIGELSELEKDIYARVLGNGVSYKDVADELKMSEEAVRKHVSRIKRKFNGKTH